MYSWLPPRGAAQAPQRQPWRRSFAPLLRTLGAGAKLSLTCFWALTTIRAAVYGRGLRCGRPRPAPWFATVCALVCHGLRLGLPRPAPWFATVCALVYRGLRLGLPRPALGLPRPAPWFATACALVYRGLRLGLPRPALGLPQLGSRIGPWTAMGRSSASLQGLWWKAIAWVCFKEYGNEGPDCVGLWRLRLWRR